MVVLQVMVDGEQVGQIPLKLGTAVTLAVADVAEPPRADPVATPCLCGSGEAFAICHGADSAEEQR
jgi:hypothetical protein